jgi:hypothetical protein
MSFKMAQAPFEQHEGFFTPPSTTNSQLSSLRTSLTLTIPAAYHDHRSGRRALLKIAELDVLAWFKDNLSVSRLNEIHEHLWLAGLPQISRALHHHVMIGRQVVITERADLHLIWHDNTVFLKPLPDYLMSYEAWEDFLCTNNELFQDAKGFLLSYMWLICHKSDLKIAHDQGLLSKDISWEKWVIFSRAVLSKIDYGRLSDVNPRYLYGELRLGRLDLVYRFCSRKRKFTTFIRGYHYGYHQYSTFIERNFAWVLTAIIYITIVLTAMQVGLASEELMHNHGFNRAAYGFTVFSILGPLIVLLLGSAVVGVLFYGNWRYAKKRREKATRDYPQVAANPRLRQYQHG